MRSKLLAGFSWSIPLLAAGALVSPCPGQSQPPTDPPAGTGAKPRSPRRNKQYKRIHQDILKPLLQGRPGAARKRLTERLVRDAEDPETWFMKAILDAQGGAIEDGEKALTTAFRLGLPRERALAGPRALLAPLAQGKLIPKLRAEFAHRPLHGPMLGHVTDAGIKVWMRTSAACKIAVLVRAASTGTEPTGSATEFTATTTEAADFTGIVQVQGLRPKTRYTYSLRIDGGDPIPGGTFTTAPTPGSQGVYRIAFGGGSGYVPPNERVWNTIREQQPDLLLLMGDNVYSDAPELPEMQRYCYYRRQSRPEFRQLVAHVPVFTIYDDHDFGTNDCFYGDAVDEPAFKPRVLEVFRQNWANPGYGQDPTPGCFYEFGFGDLAFLMLDGRYYRSNPRNPNPSMLGKQQDAWLKVRLASRLVTQKTVVHFLCSPVPWTFLAKGKSLDTWNGFREERDKLFDFIGGYKLEGIMLLSADRHRTDIWKIPRPKHYPFYEFSSSRLTNQHVHNTMKQAEYSYNAKQSFGIIDVDTTKADPTLVLKVVTIDGETVHRRQLLYSEICYK